MFDAVERMRDDLADLEGESLAGLPAAVQSQRLCDLVVLKERIDAELMRSTGQWDAEGCWGADGAVSAAARLSQHTSVSRAAATRLVRAARLVREHDATAAALASGAVTSVQVDTLAAVTRNREDLYPAGESALLAAAQALGADDFVKVARYWRSCADDALANEDAFAVHERRHLHVSKTLYGTLRIDRELDLDGGETFLNALDAMDSPEVDDGRTAAQRNADNLVQLASASLSGSRDTRPVPSASLIVGLDELTDELAKAPHDVRRELEHLGPVARTTAMRLTCDATVQRVVMSGSSEVLDLGRSTRVVSPAQRRGLLVRDRGCVFPGCDRPPKWCDAHHVRHWVKGGPTDLPNLVLLCRRHHVLCHEGGWHLARGPDGAVRAYRPDGSELVLAA